MNYNDHCDALIKEALNRKGSHHYKDYRQLIETDLVSFVNEMEATYRSIGLRVSVETEFNLANEPHIKLIFCNENDASEFFIQLISETNHFLVGGNNGISVNSNEEAINELKKLVANTSWIK